MEEATLSAAPAVPAAETAERSFGARLLGMLLEPAEEFRSIVARPRFWLPLLGWVVLGLAFTAVWMQNVDLREFMMNQIQLSGRADRIPADRMDAIIDSQTGFVKVFAWVGAVAVPLGTTLIVAGVFMLVFRFFYAGQITFAQSMAIVAWSFFTMKLVTLPATLLVMFFRGDWNVNPEEALQAGGALFVDRQTTAKPLWTLLYSLDLFSVWLMAMLSIGYGVAIRRPATTAAVGVVSAWVLYVLARVAMSAFF